MNIVELEQTNWANKIVFTKILACKSKYDTTWDSSRYYHS